MSSEENARFQMINIAKSLQKIHSLDPISKEDKEKLKAIALSFDAEICRMFSFDNDEDNTELSHFYWDIERKVDYIKTKLILIYKEFDFKNEISC